MALVQVDTDSELSDNAQFRAWGVFWHDGLDGVGLVQTADAGQIDWTTVARPAVNTDAGYEIWRFDDAEQATEPIFFRLDYGIDNVATEPRIGITIGTGSDGAGTITGVMMVRNNTTCSTSTATVGPLHICFSARSLIAFHRPSLTPNQSYGFIIERVRNADGTHKDGIFVMYLSFGNMTFRAFGDGVTGFGGASLGGSATISLDGTRHLGTLVPILRQPETYVVGVLLSRATDLPDLVDGLVDVYGSSRRYWNRAVSFNLLAGSAADLLLLGE